MSKKRVEVILDKFRQAKQMRNSKDPVWKELDAFDRNQQWELSGVAPWVPKPITNYLHLVKYTKRAAFAIDNPTGKLRPLSPKGVESVRLLDKAYQDTFDRIKARKVVRETIETAKLLGTAIAHVYWEESKEGRLGSTVLGDEGFQYEGEIGIKQIEPSTFYPDPNAFRLEDCDFIIIRERKSKTWIKNKFQSETEEQKGTNDPNERGEIYLRDYTTSQDKGLVDFISYYEREANSEGGYSYFVTHMANNKIVKDKQKLRPNRYPFAVLYDFPQRQDFWGMSTCQFILDNQKIINKVESIISMIGLLLQNPQKVVARDSGINPQEVAKYGNAPQKVWVSNVDPSRAIHHITPPQIPQPLFNLVEAAKTNIREITGLTESYMGQNVGSLQTSSGVQALIDRATIRDRDQAYDVELYIEELSKLIIDFMTTYYETERVVRILGKKPEEVEFVPFVGVEFKDLEYDIAIDVSAKAPLTRMKEMNDAKELLTMQGQYGEQFPVQILKPQEAIRMMNLAEAENIIERMDMEEAQNKAEQSMQIANMMMEAAQNGVSQDEVMQMGMSMFEQMENPNAQSQVGAPTTANPQNRPQGA